MRDGSLLVFDPAINSMPQGAGRDEKLVLGPSCFNRDQVKLKSCPSNLLEQPQSLAIRNTAQLLNKGSGWWDLNGASVPYAGKARYKRGLEGDLVRRLLSYCPLRSGP